MLTKLWLKAEAAMSNCKSARPTTMEITRRDAAENPLRGIAANLVTTFNQIGKLVRSKTSQLGARWGGGRRLIRHLWIAQYAGFCSVGDGVRKLRARRRRKFTWGLPGRWLGGRGLPIVSKRRSRVRD